MKKQIKEAPISKELEKEMGINELFKDIEDFIEVRDKTNRGNTSKSDDVRKISKAEAETKQMLYEDSMDIVPLPEGIEPMFNTIFLTAIRNKTRTSSGLFLSNSLIGGGLEVDYSSKQMVLAHGPQVQQAFTGSEVVINFENLRRRQDDSMADRVDTKSKIEIPTIMINDKEYIKLSERDLDYINKKVEKDEN